LNKDLETRLWRQQQEIDDNRRRFEARENAWEKEKLGAISLLNQEKTHLEVSVLLFMGVIVTLLFVVNCCILLQKLQSEAHTELVELGERKLALTADIAHLETTLRIQNSHANRNSQQAEQVQFQFHCTC